MTGDRAGTARTTQSDGRLCVLIGSLAVRLSGLHQVVVIPCIGSFTRVIGWHTLLITAETRDDPRRYRKALVLFQ